MSVTKSSVKEQIRPAPPALGAPALVAPALGAPALGAPALGAPALGAPASGAEEPPVLIDRVGIERAFDVVRHHTVHTKGYVMTALQLIEEFGNAADKARLSNLLRENEHAPEFAISRPRAAKKKAAKKK